MIAASATAGEPVHRVAFSTKQHVPTAYGSAPQIPSHAARSAVSLKWRSPGATSPSSVPAPKPSVVPAVNRASQSILLNKRPASSGEYFVRPAQNLEVVGEGPSLISGSGTRPTPAQRPRIALQVEDEKPSSGSIFGGGFGLQPAQPSGATPAPAPVEENPIRMPAPLEEPEGPAGLGAPAAPRNDPAVEPEDAAPSIPAAPGDVRGVDRGTGAPLQLNPGVERPGPANVDRPEYDPADLYRAEQNQGDNCTFGYNGREICEETKDCEKGFAILRGSKLSDISLDISPPIIPQETSAEKLEEKRRQTLDLDAYRPWKNTDYVSLQVANGKLIGLGAGDWGLRADENHGELFARYKETSGGNFVVETEKGSLLKLPIKSLSLDDRYFVQGRAWNDRFGRRVAFGRFIDFENSKVIIENNGVRSDFYVYELGRDELSYLAAYWNVPAECSLGNERFQPRNWTMVTFAWKASGLCHKPLYWEHIQLERYGHTYGPVAQPLLSGAHFFGTALFLPYKMGIDNPFECKYALGYYRPNSCAPHLIPPIPLSPRGALYQAAAITGTAYLLPF